MLAIAGDGSKRYQARMRALATGVGVADRVIWLGHLPESVMTWAYQQSLAFLMTSRVEACPNTALEALANGSMSISTRCPPMPEFFGDTARYYERDDARGLACQIDAVAGYPREERAMRAVVSEQRAAAFSWDATADRTVHELHRAVAER
jgi:1,2-diacylglycerol 3-alpha-glucosyltransferase